MSKNKDYTDAPEDIARELENSVPVADFLPSPAEIAAMLKKEVTIPVTMKLKRRTLEKYRTFAHRTGVRYQTFISTLLDAYAKKI